MEVLLTTIAILDHSVSHHSCHLTPPPPILFLSPLPAQNTFPWLWSQVQYGVPQG